MHGLVKKQGVHDKDKSREKGNFSRNKIRLLMYFRPSSCVVKTTFTEGFTLDFYKTRVVSFLNSAMEKSGQKK